MDVFDLFAKISVDTSGYEKGLSEASGKTSTFGQKLKTGLAAAGKLAAAAVSAAGAVVVAVTKNSIEAYSEYEQLVGGSKLVFGGAYDFIAEKAKGAYSTVQLSQNDYLKQVNGFAVGLKTSLGGNEMAAAQLADKIVNAEADIVAAMGITQESAQNAFNGIMKGNYMMLDNLMLGITPTKAGFQEIIDKVNEWNAANGNATQYTIDNLADCQSALVDYIDMQGLSGYAANEAAGTIQGSLASVKAAWQNVLVAMADSNGNLGESINGLVTSATSLGKNLMPVISNALSGIGQLVAGIAPVLTERLPGILNDALPQLVGGALALLEGVTAALPGIAQAVIGVIPTIAAGLISALPQLATAAVSIIAALASGLGAALPALIPAAVEAIITVVTALLDNVPLLVSAAADLIVGLATGLIGAIPQLLEAAPQIIAALATALIGAIPEIARAALEIIQAFGQAMYDAAPESLRGVIDAIGNAFAEAWALVKTVWDAVSPYFAALWAAIQAVWNAVAPFFKAIFQSAWDGVKTIWNVAASFFSAVWNSIAAVFSVVKSVLTGDFQGAWDGIRSIVSTWGAFFAGVWNTIKGHFSNVASFFGNAFSSAKSAIVNAVQSIPSYFSQLWANIKSIFSNVGAWFSSVGQAIVSGIRNGISAGWSALTGFVAEKAKSLLNAAKSALGIASPSKKTANEIGLPFAQGIAMGVTMEMPRTIRDIQKQLDFVGGLRVPGVTSGVSAGGRLANGSGGVTIIQNIYSEAKTAAELMREARWEAQKAVMMGV